MGLSENRVYLGLYNFVLCSKSMKINHGILASPFSDNPIWQPIEIIVASNFQKPPNVKRFIFIFSSFLGHPSVAAFPAQSCGEGGAAK